MSNVKQLLSKALCLLDILWSAFAELECEDKTKQLASFPHDITNKLASLEQQLEDKLTGLEQQLEDKLRGLELKMDQFISWSAPDQGLKLNF